MAAINPTYVQLAKSLHPKLLKFFARYPPAVLSSSSAGITLSKSNSYATEASVESSSAPNTLKTSQNNPFLPIKSPTSAGWYSPKYSLRQQADLYKLAEQQGVAELLPHTIKSLDERTRKREEFGLRVKGTGVGQSVKGHVSERYLYERLEKRKTAMKRMPGLIRFWRLRNRSKGWKNWPKAGR